MLSYPRRHAGKVGLAALRDPVAHQMTGGRIRQGDRFPGRGLRRHGACRQGQCGNEKEPGKGNTAGPDHGNKVPRWVGAMRIRRQVRPAQAGHVRGSWKEIREPGAWLQQAAQERGAGPIAPRRFGPTANAQRFVNCSSMRRFFA